MKCRKEPVELVVDLNHKFFFVELLCSKCKRKEEDIGEPTSCFECGKSLVTFKEYVETGKKLNGTCGYCYSCRDKKIAEAREKGMCILCFERQQADILNNAGEKGEVCEECARAWADAWKIHTLNDEIFKKIERRKK